jgi:hypothetical protein
LILFFRTLGDTGFIETSVPKELFNNSAVKTGPAKSRISYPHTKSPE